MPLPSFLYFDLGNVLIPFNPRWQTLPDGFWDFLGIGVGGYVGGRSIEKAAWIFARRS